MILYKICSQIDHLVYKLYELTDLEIKFFEYFEKVNNNFAGIYTKRSNSCILQAGGEGADIHVGPKEQKNRTFFCDQEKSLSQMKVLE